MIQKLTALLTVLAAVLVLTGGGAAAGVDVADSPGSGTHLAASAGNHDADNRPARANGSQAAGTLEWADDTEGYSVNHGPAVVDGVVYYTNRSTLTAVDAETGAVEWTRGSGDNFSVQQQPLVVGDTVVASGVQRSGEDFSWHLFGFDAETGDLKWSYRHSNEPTALSVTDGTVFFATMKVPLSSSVDPRLHAVNASTGDREWVYDMDHPTSRVPTAVDGTVYLSPMEVEGHGDAVIAVDAETGRTKWTYSDVESPSAVTVADGTVYVSGLTADPNLATPHDYAGYAIDAETGDEQWSFSRSGIVLDESPPTVGNGTVYFTGYRAAHVYAVDAATGQRVWNFTSRESGFMDSTATVANGRVYVGGADGSLYALDASTGETEWAFTDPDGTTGGSPVVADGTVYYPAPGDGTGDGGMYAVATAHGGDSDGSRVRHGTVGQVETADGTSSPRPPTLSNATADTVRTAYGTVIEVAVDATDPDGSVASVTAAVGGNDSIALRDEDDDGRYTGTLEVYPEEAGESVVVEFRATDDAGNVVTTNSTAAVAVEPIDGTVPNDPDGDGEYEDVNGDGTVGFNDLVTFYQHMTDPVMTDHVAAYDYTDDGELDFNDLVALYRSFSE